MRHQKPLAVRIFIWICVVFMALSLIWVYVVYMFTPQEQAGENNDWIVTYSWTDVEVSTWVNSEDLILMPSDINPENPEETAAPILVTEDGEVDEMNQMVEVQLANWETELVRQWDLWDAITIN